MDKSEKNEISHRTLALQKLKEFLLTQEWKTNNFFIINSLPRKSVSFDLISIKSYQL